MRPPPAPRPNLAPKVYPDVEPGDHVYFHHPQRGPMSARVLATGKHGLTATCPLGDLYRVHWQRVLGVKERMQRPFKLVENGAEGFILEDDQGVRRYVAHDPKGDDEPDDEPPANPPRNRKKKLEKSLPAKGHALLLKTFIQGYVKQDGTTVRAHSDKRPPAHDAQDTAQALGGDLTGSAIPNDLVPVTGLNLLDQIIHDHADLARVCQAYRNPFYETFRVFYVRKGIIVGQCGLSARMPSTTPVPRGYEIEVRQQAERLKAEQIWLVHNHPSGDPEPSQADIRYTFEAEQALPQFAGHVIINNGKYSAYSPKTGWTINIPFKQPGILEDDISGGIVTYNLENSGNFGKQHQWLMKAPEDDPGVLAKIAKHAATAPDNLVLTSLVKLPGKIRAIAELPRNSLEDPERAALRAKLRSATGEFITRQRETVMAYLRLFARQTGATQGMILFCPHARREDYAWLCEANVLRDVLSVDEDGHLRSVAADFPDLIDPAKGAWIGVDQPKTELVEEFFSRMGYDEPPTNPPRNRKKKLEKSLPAKGCALLLKTFIQGYVKQDGTTVRAHSDKRPPAQKKTTPPVPDPPPLTTGEAVMWYQDYGYQPINEHLRGNPANDEIKPKVQSAIKAIDEALSKQRRDIFYAFRGDGAAISAALFERTGISEELKAILPKDSKSRRDAVTLISLKTRSGQSLEKFLNDRLVGQIFTDAGFASTTNDRDLALSRFSHNGGELTEHGILGVAEIVGHHVQSLNADEFSVMDAKEGERLLPRNCRFTIKRIRIEAGENGAYFHYLIEVAHD